MVMTRMGTITRSFSAASPAEDTGEVWQRWLPVWHAFFYLVLVAALVVVFTAHTLDTGRSALVAGISGAFAAWYWGTIVRHPEWQRRPRPLGLYFAGAIPLFLTLVTLDGVFFYLTACLYLQLFSFLPLRWSIPGASLLTLVLATLQVIASGQPVQNNGIAIAVFVIPALLGMGLTVYIRSIIAQSTDRQRLIVELETTRQELAERERLAGALEERQRLAREIHDTLAQSLISIIINLETAETALPAQAAPGHAVRQAHAIARQSLTEARRSVHGLRPDALEGTSLPDAMRRLAAVNEKNDVATSMAVTGTPRRLHPDVEVALLRVAQEATTNVQKHAGPCRMALTLSYVGDLVILDVCDDGVGMDIAACDEIAAGDGGFGMISMRERVEALNGTFSVESTLGEGTTVTATLRAAAGVPA